MRCSCGARCINRGSGSECRICAKKGYVRKKKRRFWETIERLEGVVARYGAGHKTVPVKRASSTRRWAADPLNESRGYEMAIESPEFLHDLTGVEKDFLAFMKVAK
jgi:hypothetical protein